MMISGFENKAMLCDITVLLRNTASLSNNHPFIILLGHVMLENHVDSIILYKVSHKKEENGSLD